MKSRSREIEKSDNANRGVLGILTGSEGGANAHWHTRLTGSKGHANAGVRRGSALLVVLGMLAFMLFSGLAFSVYMRQSRLPTSFLRRTVATRQLAKAALAEAIEEIDTALGNDPHPGVRGNKTWQKAASDREYASAVGYIDNIWSHRVFLGWAKGNLDSDVADNKYLSLSTDAKEQKGEETPFYSDPDETVPTLTLEGLAYLPPNLINEARYYSQRTPTAKWHSFWFDSGRYAYTAIDVSDYFDVNRVYADRPRSSGNRVSLAHLFEKITASGEGDDREVKHEVGSGADKWDQFMDEFRVADGKMPLISLADLNVAWGSKSFNFGGSAHGNPFYNFINNSGEAYSGGESDAEAYRGMSFVTDSWFPKPLTGKTADGETIYDLASQQPFEPDDLMGRNRYTLTQVMSYADGLFGNAEPISSRMNMLTKAALWDYLDQDKVPLSLAIPTCEQVPMICAIEPIVSGLNIKIIPDGAPAVPDGSPITLSSGEVIQYFKKTVTYKLDLDGINAANIAGHYAITYPFLLKGQNAQTVLNTSATDDGFSVDGRVALFLSNASGNDISARPGEIKGLHLESHAAVSQGKVDNEASVIMLPIRAEEYDDPANIYVSKSTDGASNGRIPVKGGNIRLDMSAAAGAVPLVTVTYRWPNEVTIPGPPASTIRQSLNPGSTYNYSDGSESITITPPTAGEFAVLKNGVRDVDYNFLRDASQTKSVKVNLALWLRVVNSNVSDNKKTADLVPACLADDQNLNGVGNDGMANKLGDYNPYPLIRLDVGTTFDFSYNAFESGAPLNGGQALELRDTQLYTGDPRYNHAVENWEIVTGQGTFSQPDDLAAKWYDREYADAKNKDGDIYMATSDQGCMQSIYELAFLPRLQDGGLTKNGMNDGFVGDYSRNYDGKIRGRDVNGDLMHRGRMWKTYSPFGRYNNVDDFDELGDGRIVSGDSGMKVNPYSGSVDVLMAAFANTPHDWRMASTNNPAIWKNGEPVLKMTKFNQDHAWNGYCEKDKGSLRWDCLTELADTFQRKVGSAAYSGNWEDAFRDLGWSYKSNELLNGQQLDTGEDSDLFSVDKKFLYGFWHDSFAARQQLFLIFVRAEPMMMGGGVSGQVPPQLGARAVALVWRDPTKTQNRSGSSGGTSTLANPHRTRILFYHQFD